MMDYTHFVFAFYVFLLVCGAIWYYGRVTRSGKKKDMSDYEKEHRLFVMYQNVEDMLDSFEEYAEGAKSGIDERLAKVESLIEDLRKELASGREARAREESRTAPVREMRREEADIQPAPIDKQADTIDKQVEIVEPAPEHTQQESMFEPDPEPESRTKTEKPQKETKSPAEKPKLKTPDLIQQYAEQGMNKEEIAKALGISKREVSLIMEIKKIKV